MTVLSKPAPTSKLASLLALFALIGCGDATEETYDTVEQEIARAGAWKLPARVRAVGETQWVRYDGAPAFAGGANCSGTFTAGARVLGEFLVENFKGAKYYQGYNCRTIAGSSSMSIHGTGRAIDVFIPLHNGQADNDLGDPVANWLVEHAEEIGVQYIIWDRWKWSGSYSGRKDGAYTGVHPHHDHLHIELNKTGAAKRTKWFTSGGPNRGITDWDMSFQVRLTGLRSDRLQDGPSQGVPDQFVNDDLRAVVLVRNRSNKKLAEVRVGFEIRDPYVHARDYTIFTDRPALKRDFVVAGVNGSADNPAHGEFAEQRTFHLGSMLPGETKKVVVGLKVDEANLGKARHVFARAWLKNVEGVYKGATTFGTRPTKNLFGDVQKDSAAFDVLTRRYWNFNASDPEQLEGWRACRRGHHDRLLVHEKALRLRVTGRHNCIESPAWTRVPAGQFDEMVIRMRSFDGPHKTAVFWAAPGADWSRDRRIVFDAPGHDGSFRTVVVPLGESPSWIGQVGRLRIDPLEGEEPADGDRRVYDVTHVFFQNSQTRETSVPDREYVDQGPVDVLYLPVSATESEPPTEPPAVDPGDDAGASDQDEDSFLADDAAQEDDTEVDGGSDPETDHELHVEEELPSDHVVHARGGCSTASAAPAILPGSLFLMAGFRRRRRSSKR